jgi:hypothetical protein
MDERCFSRVDVDRPADIAIGEFSLSALVYNLSASGCMLDGVDSSFVVGDPVSVSLDGLPKAVDGHVVWKTGQYAGVQFETCIDQHVVNLLGFTPPVASLEVSQPVATAETIGPADDADNADVAPDNRQHPRISVDCHVSFEAGAEHARVLVYDLSIGGCMFEVGQVPPGIGHDISLVFAGSPHAARVVWVVGACVGAKFVTDLHAAIIAHYGFKPSQQSFESLMPQDKFGRPLPALARLPV